MNRNTLLSRIGPLLLIVVVLGGAWWWWSQNQTANTGDLKVSGTVESDKVRVAAEVGGVVLSLNVTEGQTVKAGDVLAQINDASAQAQHDQAQAALRVAQANLALLQAGATTEQVKEVEAQAAQAEASLALAQANLTNLVGETRPEDVLARWQALNMARTNYAQIQGSLTPDALNELVNAANTAEGNLTQAQARHTSIAKDQRVPQYVLSEMELAVQEAQAMRDAMQALVKMTDENGMLDHAVIEQTQLALELAKSNLAIARARRTALTLDDRTPTDALTFADDAVTDADTMTEDVRTALEALQDDPLGKRLTAAWQAVTTTQTALNDLLPTTAPANGTAATANTTSRTTGTSLEAVLRQIDVATAARDFAAARLAEVKTGARAEQLAVAEAQVASAQAQVKMLELQLAKYTLQAPIDGVILSRGVAAGEMAAPGAVLFEIGDLQHLRVTVYLPEEYFGRVKPGDEAQVTADAYPDRTFTAHVDRLANQAEYTSRNVQTVEGRRDTVFAMYLSIENADLALVPGMWADVKFALK